MKKSIYLSGLLAFCLMLGFVGAKAASPTITSSPVNAHVCRGSHAHFVVGAIDTPGGTAQYKWSVSTDGGSTWSFITSAGTTYSGITTDSLGIVNTTAAMNGYKYKATVNDSAVATHIALSGIAILNVDTAFAGPITGDSTICPGSTITLADTSAGGVWSAVNAKASVSASGIVTGHIAGVDTIKYAYTNLCGVTTVSKKVTVNALPAVGVITGATAFCQGSTTTFADTAAGGVWSSTTTSVATIGTDGVATAVAQGFDTIKYTLTNAFCSASASFVTRVDTIVIALPVTGPTVTCVGNFVDFMNVNVLGTWTWTASNAVATVSSTGTVTGAMYGTDTITYTFTNTCNTVSSSDTVHVDTLIAHGVISGASSVCAGSFITLTETVPGGTWLSSNSSLAIVDGAGDVTGVSEGTVTISYFFANGCGASSATHDMTIYDAANPITGLDSVGVGNTRALSDVTIGGTWSSSNTAIATVNSAGVVTGVAIGTATITYTVTNLCGTTYSTLLMNVGAHPTVAAITPTPVAPAFDSVCLGSTITLADATGGGKWSVAADTIATVDSSTGVVTGVAHGAALISYTVTTGFGSTSVTQVVFVNIAPHVVISAPTITATGGTYYPLAFPDGGVWTSSNDSIAAFVGSGNIFDTLIGGVRYDEVSFGVLAVININKINKPDTLTYSVRNTCGSGSGRFFIPKRVIVNAVPVVNSNVSLNVYPNPAHGNITVNLTSDIDEQATITITDITGKKITEQNMTTNRNYNIGLDVPTGMYLLTVTTPTGHYTAKITVAQ